MSSISIIEPLLFFLNLIHLFYSIFPFSPLPPFPPFGEEGSAVMPGGGTMVSVGAARPVLSEGRGLMNGAWGGGEAGCGRAWRSLGVKAQLEFRALLLNVFWICSGREVIVKNACIGEKKGRSWYLFGQIKINLMSLLDHLCARIRKTSALKGTHNSLDLLTNKKYTTHSHYILH